MELRSEDQRHLPGENIAENSSSDTRDDSQEHGDWRGEIQVQPLPSANHNEERERERVREEQRGLRENDKSGDNKCGQSGDRGTQQEGWSSQPGYWRIADE